MPRLQNKGYTARAPDGAGSWPEIPDIDPQLSEIDGGKTNAAFQRWNDLVRARLGGNEQQDNGRFKNIQTTIDRQDGYLESVWTMQAIAGPIVTGMTLFASTGQDDNQNVSYIAFQADRFLINTAAENKQIFSATASAVKLGDVLTVDLANAKMFIGVGTYGNANTSFYVDDDGYLSLKDKLTFDPTGAGTLTISGTIIAAAGLVGGWVIGSTFLADAAGLVGMSSAVTAGDDIRFWAGNVTAGSAPFRVYESGVLTATAAIISGTGVNGDYIAITGSGLQAGSNVSTGVIYINNNGGVPYINMRYNGNVRGSWAIANEYSVIQLSDGGTGGAITIDPRSGISLIGGAQSFVGDGSGLNALAAGQITTGTLNNARLPAAISVTSLESSGAGNFGSVQIGATEIVTSGRFMNSVGINCDDTDSVKCNLLTNTVGGADTVFANYMRIFMNGGTCYVPYRTTAP